MINNGILSLPENYIFEKLKREAAKFREDNPNCELFDLSIGDVCGPLPDCAASALIAACAEMKNKNTFRGYGPAEGFGFLREALCGYYCRRGILLNSHEFFITDGSKPAISDILSLFCGSTSVIFEPTYPVYSEASLLRGFDVLICGFKKNTPRIPENVRFGSTKFGDRSLIFLCSPNNPDGYAYSLSELKSWVDFAVKSGSIILFDAAYERFISSRDVPHSVFEVDGGKNCAIEFGSFSKFAGFTGLRCGWCVVPEDLKSDNYSLNVLYRRVLSTISNGVSYPVQRAASAVLTESGLSECTSLVNFYRKNAQLLRQAFEKISLEVTSGGNSPYLCVKTPNGIKSDIFVSKLLRHAHTLTSPSSGFGSFDDDFIRVSCLCDRETAEKAAESISNSADIPFDN